MEYFPPPLQRLIKQYAFTGQELKNLDQFQKGRISQAVENKYLRSLPIDCCEKEQLRNEIYKDEKKMAELNITKDIYFANLLELYDSQALYMGAIFQYLLELIPFCVNEITKLTSRDLEYTLIKIAIYRFKKKQKLKTQSVRLCPRGFNLEECIKCFVCKKCVDEDIRYFKYIPVVIMELYDMPICKKCRWIMLERDN